MRCPTGRRNSLAGRAIGNVRLGDRACFGSRKRGVRLPGSRRMGRAPLVCGAVWQTAREGFDPLAVHAMPLKLRRQSAPVKWARFSVRSGGGAHKAGSASGQAAGFSTRKQGFDSPTRYAIEVLAVTLLSSKQT